MKKSFLTLLLVAVVIVLSCSTEKEDNVAMYDLLQGQVAAAAAQQRDEACLLLEANLHTNSAIVEEISVELYVLYQTHSNITYFSPVLIAGTVDSVGGEDVYGCVSVPIDSHVAFECLIHGVQGSTLSWILKDSEGRVVREGAEISPATACISDVYASDTPHYYLDIYMEL